MKPTRSVLILLLVVGVGFSAGAQTLDLEFVAPGIDLSDFFDQDDQDRLDDFLSEAGGPLDQLEDTINAEDLGQYADLPLLAKAAANAGSAAAHLGTQRAFSDYRAFALVIGTGSSLAIPDVDPSYLERLQEDVESSGDIYVGAAIQPVTASLGINLSRLIPRTRADVKLGYANIPDGTIEEGLSFNALSVGVNANYQLLRSRQLPLGFVRWRGLTLASGFMYQRNETNLTVDIAEDSFNQVLYADPDLSGDPNFNTDGSGNPIATLTVSPSVTVAMESKTYTIPLEATTGLRLLWLLDVNFGAGVDLVFGESELVFGADAALDVTEVNPDYVEDTSPGSVGFGVTNTEAPQFFRPRITGGVGVNLGPIKLDVPLMLYFDQDGNTVMAGVNVGIVF
ncbi:MAG: hypothetical protein WD492_14470 [Alkalispirochaeta sp.]